MKAAIQFLFPNGVGTRAMLALVVIAFACVTLSILSLRGNEPALAGLVGLASSIVTFYFVDRERAAQSVRSSTTTVSVDPGTPGEKGDA